MSSTSASGEGDSNEADFFDSLMSELSEDLEEDRSTSVHREERKRGTRHHDSAGPNPRNIQSQKVDKEEDSFFANLMSELGGSIDEPRSSGSDSDLDDDDFFSNLEAELSQSLGGDSGADESASSNNDDDDDDFFANLQREMGNALEESSDNLDEEALGDDFFSGLIDDIADEVEASSREDSTSGKSNSVEHGDITKMSVPELKDILRSKGLKVGGKKSELIERLQQS